MTDMNLGMTERLKPIHERVERMVRDEIIPLETLDLDRETFARITAPLKEQVKEQGLWAAPLPPELGGRDGPEPVRYGDWEKKGIAIDF